jgi:hypothetical protein
VVGLDVVSSCDAARSEGVPTAAGALLGEVLRCHRVHERDLVAMLAVPAHVVPPDLSVPEFVTSHVDHDHLGLLPPQAVPAPRWK